MRNRRALTAELKKDEASTSNRVIHLRKSLNNNLPQGIFLFKQVISLVYEINGAKKYAC